MATNFKLVKIYEDDYASLMRIKGFLQMQSGENCSVAEAFHEVLARFDMTATLPKDMFQVVRKKGGP